MIEKTKEPPVVIIEAPTGYGKTVSGPLIFERLTKNSFAHSFLHVLPLRAIVDNFYKCVLLRALDDNARQKLEARCKTDDQLLNEVRRSLERAGILSSDDIAYQMGEYIELGRKEPLFDARYIVTTLDSFIYNLFRIPVTEFLKTYKHYAIPRLRVFISGVLFDEAHAVFEDSEQEESSMYTAFVQALSVLRAFENPIILATATLGVKPLKELLRRLGYAYVIRLGLEDREHAENSYKILEVKDRDFVEKMTSIEWKTSTIRSENVIQLAIELVSRGLRVFIACDTVRSAIENYSKAYSEVEKRGLPIRVFLLHGFMTRGDRREALAELEHYNAGKKGHILIATSVVEAGINMSFDVLISEGARPRSLIQRAGRVCRYGECREADVFIIEDRRLDPTLKSFINSAVNKNKSICWRLPFDYEKYAGYEKLLENLEVPREDPELSRSLEALAMPLFISSSTINHILNRYGGALIRVELIEVCVFEDSDVESRDLSFEELYDSCLPVPAYRFNKLLENNCVKGFYAFYEDRGRPELICSTEELIDRGRFSFIKYYFKCLVKAAKKASIQRRLVYAAALSKKECYERRAGFRIGYM